MKGRESGMPGEACWNGFFDAEALVGKMVGPGGSDARIVEFGCGYGTFSVPAARRTTGLVFALDIEPSLIARVRQKARAAGLKNLRAEVRDFVESGTGLESASAGCALAFNILHIENPLGLLGEAHRILQPGGILAVIHWQPDPSTPRGPPLGIRPTPAQCIAWAEQAGFQFVRNEDLFPCARYHYGLLLRRPRAGQEFRNGRAGL